MYKVLESPLNYGGYHPEKQNYFCAHDPRIAHRRAAAAAERNCRRGLRHDNHR